MAWCTIKLRFITAYNATEVEMGGGDVGSRIHKTNADETHLFTLHAIFNETNHSSSWRVMKVQRTLTKKSIESANNDVTQIFVIVK